MKQLEIEIEYPTDDLNLNIANENDVSQKFSEWLEDNHFQNDVDFNVFTSSTDWPILHVRAEYDVLENFLNVFTGAPSNVNEFLI